MRLAVLAEPRRRDWDLVVGLYHDVLLRLLARGDDVARIRRASDQRDSLRLPVVRVAGFRVRRRVGQLATQLRIAIQRSR